MATATEGFAVDAAAAGCAAVFFVAACDSGMVGVLLATATAASGEKDCAVGASRGVLCAVLGTAFAVCIAPSVDGVGADAANGYTGVLTDAELAVAALAVVAASTRPPAFVVCDAEFPSRGPCSDREYPASLPAAFSSSIKVANGEPASGAGAALPGVAGIFTNVATELAAGAITSLYKAGHAPIANLSNSICYTPGGRQNSAV